MIGIYHSADLDGLACGAILKMKYGEAINLIPFNYGEPTEEILPLCIGQPVIMCDVSMDKEHMDFIANESERFLWIDHHNVEWKHPKVEIVSGDEAACQLTWDCLFKNQPRPTAIDLLGDYDVFKKDSSFGWEETVLPFQVYMRTRFELDRVYEHIATNMFTREGVEIGRNILVFERYQFEFSEKHLWWFNSKYAQVNYTANPSRFADYLFKKYPEMEACFFYYHSGSGIIKYSVRSPKNSDFDCGEYSKKFFGGGGRKNTAGFVTQRRMIRV